MGKDCVNEIFESLQSNTSRVDCFELYGLVVKVFLSTFSALLIYFLLH